MPSKNIITGNSMLSFSSLLKKKKENEEANFFTASRSPKQLVKNYSFYNNHMSESQCEEKKICKEKNVHCVNKFLNAAPICSSSSSFSFPSSFSCLKKGCANVLNSSDMYMNRFLIDECTNNNSYVNANDDKTFSSDISISNYNDKLRENVKQSSNLLTVDTHNKRREGKEKNSSDFFFLHPDLSRFSSTSINSSFSSSFNFSSQQNKSPNNSIKMLNKTFHGIQMERNKKKRKISWYKMMSMHLIRSWKMRKPSSFCYSSKYLNSSCNDISSLNSVFSVPIPLRKFPRDNNNSSFFSYFAAKKQIQKKKKMFESFFGGKAISKKISEERSFLNSTKSSLFSPQKKECSFYNNSFAEPYCSDKLVQGEGSQNIAKFDQFHMNQEFEEEKKLINDHNLRSPLQCFNDMSINYNYLNHPYDCAILNTQQENQQKKERKGEEENLKNKFQDDTFYDKNTQKEVQSVYMDASLKSENSVKMKKNPFCVSNYYSTSSSFCSTCAFSINKLCDHAVENDDSPVIYPTLCAEPDISQSFSLFTNSLDSHLYNKNAMSCSYSLRNDIECDSYVSFPSNKPLDAKDARVHRTHNKIKLEEEMSKVREETKAKTDEKSEEENQGKRKETEKEEVKRKDTALCCLIKELSFEEENKWGRTETEKKQEKIQEEEEEKVKDKIKVDSASSKERNADCNSTKRFFSMYFRRVSAFKRNNKRRKRRILKCKLRGDDMLFFEDFFLNEQKAANDLFCKNFRNEDASFTSLKSNEAGKHGTEQKAEESAVHTPFSCRSVPNKKEESRKQESDANNSFFSRTAQNDKTFVFGKKSMSNDNSNSESFDLPNVLSSKNLSANNNTFFFGSHSNNSLNPAPSSSSVNMFNFFSSSSSSLQPSSSSSSSFFNYDATKQANLQYGASIVSFSSNNTAASASASSFSSFSSSSFSSSSSLFSSNVAASAFPFSSSSFSSSSSLFSSNVASSAFPFSSSSFSSSSSLFSSNVAASAFSFSSSLFSSNVASSSFSLSNFATSNSNTPNTFMSFAANQNNSLQIQNPNANSANPFVSSFAVTASKSRRIRRR